MDQAKLKTFIGDAWDKSIVPTLEEYIRIPNLSPQFDPEWASKPDTENAVKLMTEWAQNQKLDGLKLEANFSFFLFFV
jgi:hypothetical protein